MSSHIDREKTKKTLALVLDKIKTEADPWLLGEYLGLFKKEVSVFHRSEVAAYLLMLYDQEKSPRSGKRNDSAGIDKTSRKTGSNRYTAFAAGAADEDTQRYPLADEESKRLFFSVGRSRRVFPRELLGLINSKTAIPREDIGVIRVLDNYSFVQVRDTAADTIIETLNGLNFRGRPLTVNYAKSRKDEENNAAESSAEGSAFAGTESGVFGSAEYTETDDAHIQASEQDHAEEENI